MRHGCGMKQNRYQGHHFGRSSRFLYLTLWTCWRMNTHLSRWSCLTRFSLSSSIHSTIWTAALHTSTALPLSTQQLYFALGRNAKYCKHHDCMSLCCLSVCLSARISKKNTSKFLKKTYVRISPNFMHMSSVAVAQSSSDANVIRWYVILLVLWMTSRFHIGPINFSLALDIGCKIKKRIFTISVKTIMSLLFIVWPKCTLAASHASGESWWVCRRDG